MHPGVKLLELIKERGISQKDFSEELGVAPSLLNGILKGDRNITTSIAISLGALGFNNANHWLKLQLKHSLEQELNKKEVIDKTKKLKEWTEVSKIVPISFFKKDTDLEIKGSESLSDIYKIYNVKDYNQLVDLVDGYSLSHFRKSYKLDSERNNLIAWSVLAEYKAKKEKLTTKFDVNSINSLIEELKEVVYINKKTISKTKKILNKYGIKFFTLHRPNKTHADGKSFISGEYPVIVLSLKYKRLDNFAFTVFHEIFHVYLHLFSDKYVSNILDQKQIDLMELEADREAKNTLIPSELWDDFIYNNDVFSDDVIEDFCDTYRIHPGVVRGRVCFENPEYYRKRTRISEKNILDIT